jgi:hypothetical protein
MSASQKKWITVSGIAFLISFLASILLVLFGNRLSDFGITNKIYYLILIPLGFSSAAFLSGAMKSYASYSSEGSSLPGKLRLAGPIVVFLLVVIGGFYIPGLMEVSQTFDLKVRILSDDQETSKFDEGSLRMYLDDKTYAGNIREGEVVFSTIPNEFQNRNVRFELLVEGFQLADLAGMRISKARQVLDLKVVKMEAYRTTQVRGSVTDELGNPIQNALLNFSSGLATGPTNELGDFNIHVPIAPGSKIPLRILYEGKIVFNENVTLDASSPYSFKISIK